MVTLQPQERPMKLILDTLEAARLTASPAEADGFTA